MTWKRTIKEELMNKLINKNETECLQSGAVCTMHHRMRITDKYIHGNELYNT